MGEIAFERGVLAVEGIKDGVVYSDSVKTTGETESVKVEKVLAADSDEDIEIYELTGIDGEGRIEHDGESYPLKKGDSYFLPAGMGCVTLNGNMTVIASEI